MKRTAPVLLAIAFGFLVGRMWSRDHKPNPRPEPTITAVSVIDHAHEHPRHKWYAVAETRTARDPKPGTAPPNGALVVELRTPDGLHAALVCVPD